LRQRVSKFASWWGLSWEGAVRHLANIDRITRNKDIDRITRDEEQDLLRRPPPPGQTTFASDALGRAAAHGSDTEAEETAGATSPLVRGWAESVVRRAVAAGLITGGRGREVLAWA
jgi:hypothetical protein